MNLYRFRDETDNEIAEVLSIDEESARLKLAETTRLVFHLIEEEPNVSVSEFLPVVVKNNFRPF